MGNISKSVLFLGKKFYELLSHTYNAMYGWGKGIAFSSINFEIIKSDEVFNYDK